MTSFLIARLPSHLKSLEAVEYMQKNDFLFRISSNSKFLNLLMSSEGVEGCFATAAGVSDEFKPEKEEKELIQQIAITQVKEEVEQDGATEARHPLKTEISVSKSQTTFSMKTEDESEDDEFQRGAILNAAELLDSDDDEPPGNPIGRHLFPCPFINCASSYETFEELEEHMKIHPDTQYFSCDVCRAKFFSKGDAIAHIRQREKKESDECGSHLPSCAHLTEPLRFYMLTGEKPFACGVCEKRFAFKEIFKMHEQIHEEDKPFKCVLCDFKCKNPRSMERHQQEHTRGKPFGCGYCEKRFSQKGHVRVHEMTHTGEKPFECKDCERRFTQRSKMNLHIRALHSNKKSFETTQGAHEE